MSQHPESTPESRASTKDAAKVSAVAGFAASIEYYDFFIYGLASAFIFPRIFFPDSSPIVGIILSFAAFGIGFIARPLGGLIFGHLGDRGGRKKALVVALLTMGVATFLVGCLPTAHAVGNLAPVLLVALRLLQGIAIGGQQGGVVLLAVESAPAKRKGFFGSISSMGAPGGTLLANLVFLLLTTLLSPEAMEAWGWRVGFWSSIALVFLAIFIHFRLEETQAFKNLKKDQEATSTDDAEASAGTRGTAKAPILTVIAKYPQELLLSIGVYLGLNVTFWLFVTFVVTYGTSEEFLGLPDNSILTAMLIASVVQLFGLGWAGWLSDRIGRSRTIVIGAMLLAIYSFAFWPLINTMNLVVIAVAMAIGLGILHSMIYGVQPTLFAESFEAEVRYSGVSMGIQFATVIGGAFAPMIATWLANGFGWISLSLYMAGASLITAVCAFVLGRRNRVKLTVEAQARA
ncbi:MFS transporter [Brevibacterium sp. VCM10]|uniref:MFS transporter n=1 Tax=Brevibacterium sp. VCM10 TaxID=1381751 RepID=UPI0004703420|nr:MFS transporter [Brevibacterium sp. VCM10]